MLNIQQPCSPHTPCRMGLILKGLFYLHERLSDLDTFTRKPCDKLSAMSQQDFTTFLDQLAGLDHHKAFELADREARKTEALCRASMQGRKGSRDYTAEDYLRQLKGLLFFFHSGMKADGLTNDEFNQLRPLVEAWIAKAQLKPETLDLFAC